MRLAIARHLRCTQSRVILDVRPGYACGPALLRALHLTHSSEPCGLRNGEGKKNKEKSIFCIIGGGDFRRMFHVISDW